jgi:hypothetical protein
VRVSVKQMVLTIGLCALAFYLIRVIILPMQLAAWDESCKTNLRAIGLALQAYHSDYGCYPPAYTTDAVGKPMHSWRVLILPYTDEKALAREYRLDEPWNGPNNSRLSARMPAIYECPAHRRPGRSGYAVVVGPDTAFPGTSSVAASQILDGPMTALVVEVEGAGIPWLEPRDLKLPRSLAKNDLDYHDDEYWASKSAVRKKKVIEKDFDDLRRQGFAGVDHHPLGPNMLLSSLTVDWFRFGKLADYLRALLTIAGGEVLRIERF